MRKRWGERRVRKRKGKNERHKKRGGETDRDEGGETGRREREMEWAAINAGQDLETVRPEQTGREEAGAPRGRGARKLEGPLEEADGGEGASPASVRGRSGAAAAGAELAHAGTGTAGAAGLI